MNVYHKLILDCRPVCIDGPIQNRNVSRKSRQTLFTIYYTHTPHLPGTIWNSKFWPGRV